MAAAAIRPANTVEEILRRIDTEGPIGSAAHERAALLRILEILRDMEGGTQERRAFLMRQYGLSIPELRRVAAGQLKRFNRAKRADVA